MIGAILKATNSSFQKGMAFCRSIYVKKVIKQLEFIFEQPSYHLGCASYLDCTLKYRRLTFTCFTTRSNLIPSAFIFGKSLNVHFFYKC